MRARVSIGPAQTTVAGRVVNLCLSGHELWSLPLQIAIALFLLWLQARSPAWPAPVTPLMLALWHPLHMRGHQHERAALGDSMPAWEVS